MDQGKSRGAGMEAQSEAIETEVGKVWGRCGEGQDNVSSTPSLSPSPSLSPLRSP
jgi:hypothetical protein